MEMKCLNVSLEQKSEEMTSDLQKNERLVKNQGIERKISDLLTDSENHKWNFRC